MHSTKQQLIVVCIQSLKTENSPQYLLLNLLLLLMKSTTCSDSILNDISEIPCIFPIQRTAVSSGICANCKHSVATRSSMTDSPSSYPFLSSCPCFPALI